MSEIEDEMNPESSPGERSVSGTRKVNNLPIYILGAAVGGFLLIMMLVAADRSEKQNNKKEETAIETRKSGTIFAEEITGNIDEVGIIEAEDLGIKKNKSNIEKIAENSLDENIKDTDGNIPEIKSLDRNNYNDSGPSRLGKIEEDDLVRRKSNRIQLFEKAVHSKTSISGFHIENGSSGIGGVENQLDSVRNQIRSFGKTGNPNDVYKAKLNELKGLMDGVGSNSGNSFISGINSSENTSIKRRNNEWRLNSKMEIPETSYVLRTSFVIPAILISGINSDLPGQISAQISQNVYDTATGQYLLLPQGSRLYGSYSSQVAYGQSRVLVAWNRIIFPDGRALDIGGMQGSDSAGYAGFKDRVNTHFWKVFSSAFLMSGIVAGVSLSQQDDGLINDRQTASAAMSEALGQQLGQAMTQMIMKNLNISPTIEIRPGYRFNIIVNQDLVFNKPYRPFDY